MKNILKFKCSILVLICTFLMSSCAVDDDASIQQSSNVNLEIGFASELTRFDTGTTVVSVPVDVSRAIPQLARITYTLDGTEFTQDVNSGTSNPSIEVDMTGFTNRTLTITGFQMLYAQAELYRTSVSANDTTVLVLGEDVIIQISWETTDDIDLALTSGSPDVPLLSNNTSLIDLSAGTTQLETVELLSTAADGDYVTSIVPFGAFNTPVEVTTTIFADVVHTFTTTIDQADAAGGGFFTPIEYATVVEVAQITKSGGNFTVTGL